MNKFLIIFKNSNRLNTSLTDQYHSFELMDFHRRIVRPVRILLIYRPPGLSTSLFLEEFSKLLEHITADLRHKRLLIDDIRIPRRPWDERPQHDCEAKEGNFLVNTQTLVPAESLQNDRNQKRNCKI